MQFVCSRALAGARTCAAPAAARAPPPRARRLGTLTHIGGPPGAGGTAVPRLVDIADKAPARVRSATAEALVLVPAGARAWRGDGGARAALFATAVAAGVMGAKRTADLIPMCHQLALSSCAIDVEDLGPAPAPAPALAPARAPPAPDSAALRVTCTAAAGGQATGVEMEALTGASVAALTLYDMLKSAGKGASFSVRLLRKTGGKSGDWAADGEAAAGSVAGRGGSQGGGGDGGVGVGGGGGAGVPLQPRG